MKAFARAFAAMHETRRAAEKVDAMAEYFRAADPADAAWAVHLLRGDRSKAIVPIRRLARWAMEEAHVPEWLFDECYATVGELAETMALLLPDLPGTPDLPLHRVMEDRVMALAGKSESHQRASAVQTWRELDSTERLVFNKLITGGVRATASRQLLVRALSEATGVEEGVVAHRLSNEWVPRGESFVALRAPETKDADVSRPYPFFLAYELEGDPEELGAPSEWQVEWKWDGIRAQVIRRVGRTFIWSRAEELVTDRYPELAASADFLADGTVLDGTIVPWRQGRPLPAAELERRNARKALGGAILTDVPVALVAYDLLEIGGRDVRAEPLVRRRELLEQVIGSARAAALVASPVLGVTNWVEARALYDTAREASVGGLVLKRCDSTYGEGRPEGAWWKWKVQPFTVHAVMIYAQAGHGRRASLNTEYTFAVWDGDVLVPFAKVSDGLSDEEIRELDRWIRANTVEKFGPVRHVRPMHVFEIGFDGIERSARHKSGVSVRAPRVLRWLTDRRPEEADTVAALRGLVDQRQTAR